MITKAKKIMSKNITAALLVLCCGFAALAQTTPLDSISGKIESIAADKASIVVAGKTIIVQPQVVDEYYIETGDPVIVTVAKEAGKLVAVEVNFNFDDQSYDDQLLLDEPTHYDISDEALDKQGRVEEQQIDNKLQVYFNQRGALVCFPLIKFYIPNSANKQFANP